MRTWACAGDAATMLSDLEPHWRDLSGVPWVTRQRCAQPPVQVQQDILVVCC